ncbi:succinylglutamate desuccinylase/aspartoacylase family protein [Thioalkalicoccus limnaeus]|uniref:Succinylglutamate desuccinylase/aspartoacylase family protein n=1 Tax=Thioalkalicoccus limnaeus TaxID=120681 RepID=A0ABV4BGV0_9GAMM
MTNAPLRIGKRSIEPGERVDVNIPLPSLYTQSPVFLPVQVRHGHRPGPILFVTAAIHGDEINGVEIIRRLMALKTLRHLRGTLLAIPVVNTYGFVRQSRYLPDRRDLNRCFPGSETGSLAARLANTLMREVVNHATHGIDLHTGAAHRENLPQVRTALDMHEDLPALATSFGVPVILNSELRDGSLRAAAAERGIPLLVYEAGEALRFDEIAIRAGLRGILAVMRHLGMLRGPTQWHARAPAPPVLARSSLWVRAHQSGVLRSLTALGARVQRGERLGIIADVFRHTEDAVVAPVSGVVIGRTNLPLVTEGEALYHIARFGRPDEAAETVERFQSALANGEHETDPSLQPDPEPPIV